VALAVATLFAGQLLASPASAVETEVRFMHIEFFDVAEFRALIGFQPGVYTRTVDLGIPSKAGAIYTALVDVSEGVDLYIAVIAVGHNGLVSAPSNERQRHIVSATVLGRPGQPVLQPN
jgi:hypothetical protein